MSHRSGPSSRRHSRFRAGLPAVVHDGAGDHPCVAHDLSRTGVLLEGDLPCEVGSTINLLLRIPQGGLNVPIRGRVVRVQAASGDEARISAVEFGDLRPAERDALERILARVIEGYAPAPLESIRPNTPPREIRKTLKEIPLPHRIALAARARPKEREILRHDPHPQVLEALARNPNLLRSEARSLAEVPTLLPSTLEILAADPRWTADVELQVRIVAHARTPVMLAGRIVDRLPAPALRTVLGRASLPATVRATVLRRLRSSSRRP